MKNKMFVMLLVIVLLLCFTACDNEPKKTPSQWVVDEMTDPDSLCVSAVKNTVCDPLPENEFGESQYGEMYTVTVYYLGGGGNDIFEIRYFVTIFYLAKRSSVSWNKFFGKEIKISENRIFGITYDVIEVNMI